MSSTLYFTDEAEKDARQKFEWWLEDYQNGRDLYEPENPWPHYTPEAQAFIAEWNRLMREAGLGVRDEFML